MSKPINYIRYTLSEIDPEARRIATAWVDGFEKIGSVNIEQKAKLASDIMNYAKAQLEAAQEELTKWKNWYEKVSNKYASLEAELKRVKEVATRMAKVIKLISETDHVHLASEARDGREVLTEFANLMNKEK